MTFDQGCESPVVAPVAYESAQQASPTAEPRKARSGSDVRRGMTRSDHFAEAAAFARLSFVHPKHGGTYSEDRLWSPPKLPKDANITECYHLGRLLALELLLHCKRFRNGQRVQQMIRVLLCDEVAHPRRGSYVRGGMLEELWNVLHTGLRHVDLDMMCSALDDDAEELSARTRE